MKKFEEDEDIEDLERKVAKQKQIISSLKSRKKELKEHIERLQKSVGTLGMRIEAYNVRRVSILVFPIIFACFAMMLSCYAKGRVFAFAGNILGLMLAYRSIYVIGNSSNLIVSAIIAGLTIAT